MERIRSVVELLREDVALMALGKIKVMSHGFEVTPEFKQRLEAVLDQLETFERENAQGS